MTAKVGMRSTIGLGLKEIWHKHKAATVLVLAILAVLALLVTYRGFRHMITLKNPEIDGFLNPTLVKAMIAGLGIGGLSLIGGLYFAHKLGKRTPTIVGLLIAELREKLEESRQKESKLSAPIANANNAPAIKTEESAPLSQPAKVDEGEGEAEIQQLTQQLSTQKQTTITLQNKLKKLLDFVEEMKQALQSRNDAFSHILPREDGANHPEASTSNPEDGSKDVQNVNRDPWAGTREEDARTLRTLRSDLTEAQAAKNELEDLKKKPFRQLN